MLLEGIFRDKKNENLFTLNGKEVLGRKASLYLEVYKQQIQRILNLPRTKIHLSEFNGELDQYSKFHLLPLLLDCDIDFDYAKGSLEIEDSMVVNVLKEYPTSNLWRTSNLHMGALAYVRYSRDSYLHEVAENCLTSLDKIGFSSTQWKYKGSINRVATFYHYVQYIDFFNVDISEKTKTTLNKDLRLMQNDLGSFCYPNGFSCIELDAVVVAAYLLKHGVDTSSLLKNKLFNHQFLLTENGWNLFGVGQRPLDSVRGILRNKGFMQDKLWNLKKVVRDCSKLQYDNRNLELVSDAHEVTLMSNYFALTTYNQICVALGLDSGLASIDSCGLSYVVK